MELPFFVNEMLLHFYKLYVKNKQTARLLSFFILTILYNKYSKF